MGKSKTLKRITLAKARELVEEIRPLIYERKFEEAFQYLLVDHKVGPNTMYGSTNRVFYWMISFNLSVTVEFKGSSQAEANGKAMLDFLEYMLQNGADVNYKDKDNNTALIFAANDRLPANVELLLKYGADCNAINNFNMAPLDCTIQHLSSYPLESSIECMRLLLKAGADPHRPYDEMKEYPSPSRIENDSFFQWANRFGDDSPYSPYKNALLETLAEIQKAK